MSKEIRTVHKGLGHRIAKRVLLCNLMLALSLCCLAGCGRKNKEEQAEKQGTVVFQFGNNVVTKGEVYIYINTVKERYELQYGSDVWQLSLPDGEEPVTMENLTREAVVNEIVKVKTLYIQAKDANLTLSEEEDTEILNKAKDFVTGLTDVQLETMEITEEKTYQVLCETALAAKMEAQILGEQNIEISDEEARMTTFYDMYFPCYTISEDGTVTPFTEEEKRKQQENAMQACSTLATASLEENADAENIEKLAEYYQLEQAGSKTMTTQEILETYGEEIYNLLYSMENGQYSTVMESEYGYHVFEMVALTDQKATNTRKVLLHDEAVNAQLQDSIENWKKVIDPNFSYPESIDMEVYDTIVLQ